MFSPFLFETKNQQRGEIKSTNKEIYAIYIHEEEDAKLTSLHTSLHEEGMTSPNSHNA